MKILVTGRGGAASWTVRGEQVGRELGATVKANASLADMKAADVILVVKRVPDQLLADLRRCGRPWVYDVVDAYPQREALFWTPSASISWLRGWISHLRPAGVIWPNDRMRRDADLGGRTVYHHHRPGLARNPIRARVERVGYEGHPRYLASMQGRLEDLCRRRGAALVLNPGELADVDVVLALRSRDWQSYPARHWKSNVKLANAHASGTPFIGSPECGYEETAVGCEYWADKPAQVDLALDWLETQDARRNVSERFLRAPITLARAAAQTREALCASRS